MTGAAGAASFAALWLAGSLAPGVPGQPIGVSAAFVLRTTDSAGTEAVAGTLRFSTGGELCVQVTSPHAQTMLLSPREITLFYPDRDLALVATVKAGQAPPMLGALAAGIVDPGSTLPPRSTVIETKRDGANLVVRWRVVDSDGRELGEMRAREAREGTTLLEIFDKGGKPDRKFSFGDRVLVGGRSVPRAIRAEYFAVKRTEQWELSNVMKGATGEKPCPRPGPTTKIQPLPW